MATKLSEQQGEEKDSLSEDDFMSSPDDDEENKINDSQSQVVNKMVMDKLVVRKSKNAALAIRWCLDRDAELCFGCRDDFSFFIRKHHCRSCGGVFCASCSRFQKSLPLLGYDVPTRVCGFCYHDDKLGSDSSAQQQLTKNKENIRNGTAITAITAIATETTTTTTTNHQENKRRPLGAVNGSNEGEDEGGSIKNSNSTTMTTTMAVARGKFYNTHRSQSSVSATSMTSRDSSFLMFSVAAPAWVADEASDVCQQCSTEFAILVRRHHCRGCGGLFCWTCTERRLALPHYGYVSPVRVCVSCSSPQITSVTNVPTRGGRCVIVGHNLGHVGDDVVVEVRSSSNDGTTVKCQDVHLSSSTDSVGGGETLSCTVPSGTGVQRPIRVTVNKLRGMSTYKYISPIIDKTSVVDTEGGELILTGENFGANVETVLVEWCDRESGLLVLGKDLVDKKEEKKEEKEEKVEKTLSKLEKIGKGRWRTCERVEMLVPHKVLRVNVGPGTGSHAVLHVNVSGQECHATYDHAIPLVLETTPVSAAGGVMEVVGKHFGQHASNVRLEIDGVQCTELVMVTPHTKVRCLAPRMRPIHSAFSTTSSTSTLLNTRAPHLTPPPDVKPKRRRPRTNSGDERRQLTVSVSNQWTRSEMTYVNQGQHAMLTSARSIEHHQRRGSRGGRRDRPASTPPRAYSSSTYSTSRPEKAPWYPDEHVLQCMLCASSFGFFTRKHHCRNCGIVVCAGCSKHTQHVESYGSLQRVCNRCHTDIKDVEEEINLLRNQLDHIATMRSIEAGKKRRYEHDLRALRMQEPKASMEEIRALEARIAQQDRRVASKQNQMNKTQQKLLDVTVNGRGSGGGSTRDVRHANNILPERSHSTTSPGSSIRESSVDGSPSVAARSMPPSPAMSISTSTGRRTPVMRSNKGGVIRPYSTNGSVDGRTSTTLTDDGNAHSPPPSTFSVAPPRSATRPITLRGKVQTVTASSSSSSSPKSMATSNASATMNGFPSSLTSTTTPSSPSSQFAPSTPTKSPSLSPSSEGSSSSPEHSVSPSQLLASGLLRGRTLEEYSMCTFSASPERSWVGASRVDGGARGRRSSISIVNRRRRHSSPSVVGLFDDQSGQTGGGHSRSSTSSGEGGGGGGGALFGGGGLSGWVTRRLGGRRDSNTTNNETKSSTVSSGRRPPSSSSMLVAVHRGAKCVLKELSMSDEMTRRRIEREVAIRGMFQEPVHPNIAPLEAIFYEKDLGKMYIHYRLVEVGNLADWLSGGRPQPWDIQSVFQQLAGTLVYLHSHQIVHRCLSLDNILIGIQGDAQGELPRPYVTDFGDSVIVPRQVLDTARSSPPSRGAGGDLRRHKTNNNSSSISSTSTNDPTASALTGDPSYRAPELNRGTLGATSASDMWALGVMLYKATFGLKEEPVALGGASVPIPPHRNARLRALIKALLHVDPTRRIDAIGCMVHPYFTISHAAEMHSSGNVIRTDEKLDIFKRHLSEMDRSESIQFIRVRRETVVRDVLREFSRFGRGNLEKRLIVMYEGEQGVDAGGLTKDMFTRFFHHLCQEQNGMFVASEDGSSGTTGELERGERTYLPSSTCELINYMEALGKVLAKVIMDGHTIDCSFAPVLFKHILLGLHPYQHRNKNQKHNEKLNIGFSDLESYDGHLFGQLYDNVLQKQITPEYADALALDFDGLMPNGETRIVTDANKMEYLNLRAQDILIGKRNRQLDAIRHGFNILDWDTSLDRFNETDFRTLICGPSVINAALVIENIDFDHGDWKRSKTLTHLSKYLKYLDKKHRLRAFLRFVTGSPGLPAMGLQKSEGQPAGKICFTRLPNSQRLPEAHTCFNTVDMPDYNDYNVLQVKMDQALSGDDGKFDLL